MQAKVEFHELQTTNGKHIGLATLNKPKALNALDLDMIRLLYPQLQEWLQDDNIVAVMLDAEGDKAFCAGGDVVAMHNAMQSAPAEIPQSLQDFFQEEYQLDYLIHTFGKPFIVWGNGIVMGGGLGLMAGGSHRIVTESSRIAMPEITIGLYPDVGGSWFLNKMPGGSGLFLGLTGASINAADALYINLADHFIAHQDKDAFLDAIAELNWQQDSAANAALLSDVCQGFHERHKSALPEGNVAAHQALIDRVTDAANVSQVVEQILAIDGGDDKWLTRARASLAAGSPITMHLVAQQLHRAKDLTLAECFRMEMVMSCRCGESGEFQEGVRALLIDKDNAPKWQFASVDEVPDEVVERFFTSPWAADEHPLATLEHNAK